MATNLEYIPGYDKNIYIGEDHDTGGCGRIEKVPSSAWRIRIPPCQRRSSVLKIVTSKKNFWFNNKSSNLHH